MQNLTVRNKFYRALRLKRHYPNAFEFQNTKNSPNNNIKKGQNLKSNALFYS